MKTRFKFESNVGTKAEFIWDKDIPNPYLMFKNRDGFWEKIDLTGIEKLMGKRLNKMIPIEETLPPVPRMPGHAFLTLGQIKQCMIEALDGHAMTRDQLKATIIEALAINVYPIKINDSLWQYDENVFVWLDETGNVGGATDTLASAQDRLDTYAESLNRRPTPVPTPDIDLFGGEEPDVEVLPDIDPPRSVPPAEDTAQFERRPFVHPNRGKVQIGKIRRTKPAETEFDDEGL